MRISANIVVQCNGCAAELTAIQDPQSLHLFINPCLSCIRREAAQTNDAKATLLLEAMKKLIDENDATKA